MRHLVACVAIGFAVGLGVAPAAEFSPIGRWEVTSGESRYQVDFCNGGAELCATLVWLREDARTAENAALLNRRIVVGAKPGGDNTWSGTLIYGGASYAGKVKLLSNNSMRVESCAGMLCQTFTLHRL